MDALCTLPHYLDHIAPIWRALGEPGDLVTCPGLEPHANALGLAVAPQGRGRGPLLVAGYRDIVRGRKAGYGPFVRLTHGAGQSYGGERSSSRHPSYPGGSDNGDVALFIVPNDHAAQRWHDAYPLAKIAVVGLSKPLPPREGPPDGTVAVTWHWQCEVSPETTSAWHDFRDALPALARSWHVIGHAHPRWFGALRPWYEAHGIEPVASIAEVAKRADLLVADNTSVLYEFAASGRPVVVVNARRYRKRIEHGLRFWSAVPGVMADRPDALPGAVSLGMDDGPDLRAMREAAMATVYAPGGVDEAVAAIRAM